MVASRSRKAAAKADIVFAKAEVAVLIIVGVASCPAVEGVSRSSYGVVHIHNLYFIYCKHICLPWMFNILLILSYFHRACQLVFGEKKNKITEIFKEKRSKFRFYKYFVKNLFFIFIFLFGCAIIVGVKVKWVSFCRFFPI